MISEHIFETLRDNITGLADGNGGYNIYPKKVPDGVTFTRAIAYTKLTGTAVLGLLGTDIQLTCMAKTYGDAEALSQEVAKLFANKRYSAGGDVLNTALKSINDLPQDEVSGIYLVAVTIYIKTMKAIG